MQPCTTRFLPIGPEPDLNQLSEYKTSLDFGHSQNIAQKCIFQSFIFLYLLFKSICFWCSICENCNIENFVLIDYAKSVLYCYYSVRGIHMQSTSENRTSKIRIRPKSKLSTSRFQTIFYIQNQNFFVHISDVELAQNVLD